MASRYLCLEEEENKSEESINNYKYLFYNYEKNIPTLNEALNQMFKSSGLDDTTVNNLTEDIIMQCKMEINNRFYKINQKYKNISKNDAYIICSYTCETSNPDYRIYSPYKLLNKNLVSKDRQYGIGSISKYLFILLKALRKLDRYYPTETKKYLYRGISQKVSHREDPSNNKLIPYINGNKKIFWGFTSTSTNNLTGISFLGKNKLLEKEGYKTGTIFTLTGDLWGYDIKLLNIFNEEEILLEPERIFIVDDVMPLNDIISVRCKIIESPVVLDFIGGNSTPSKGNNKSINNNLINNNVINNGINNNVKNQLVNGNIFIAQIKVETQIRNVKNYTDAIGYLCNINTKNIKVLITYNKYVGLEFLNNMQKLIVYINNEEIEIDMNTNRYKYTNEQLDITMIEILDEDNINTFLEIDSDIDSKNYINENIEAVYLQNWNSFSKTNGKIIKKNNNNYICDIKSLNHGIILNKKSQLIGIIKEKNINNSIEFIPMNIIINKINYIKCIYDIKRDMLGKEIQILNNKEDKQYIYGEQTLNREIINNIDVLINGEIKSNILTHKFNKDGLLTIYVISNEIFTNTSYMFSGCSLLKQIDFSSFNTEQLTKMNKMFSGCSSLKEIDLSSFNTAQVTDMSGLFSDCSSLIELNLSSLKTNQVKDMSRMFSGCSSLKRLNLSSFNTNQVIDMSYMFSECTSLESLNLSSFNTNQITNMSGMFSGCSSLRDLRLSSSFNANQGTDMSDIFSRCSSLKELNCIDSKIKKEFKILNGEYECECSIM